MELEEDIRIERQLPYTITVEKVEGDIVWTHNQWGNSMKYKMEEDGSFTLINSLD